MSQKISPDTTIGHYSIVSKLGAGAMGEVYLATDTRLDRKVALKILPSAFAADADRMSRFVREAKSASGLNHPNIITIYEIGESDGTHFIATEFIDGKTLGDYAKAKRLDHKEILEIAIQVASALQVAHAANIVHRDIKPDNVMIRADGLAKILDFGIAKLSMATESGEEAATAIQSTTTPGMIIGTPNYMSPEQARGRGVNHQTDIFSFGVVFYEMLSGSSPFKGETVSDVIANVLTKEPQPLENVPTKLAAVVQKSLEKDKQKRYQTAKDLLDDLKGVRQGFDSQSRLDINTPPNKDEPKTQILQAATTAATTRDEPTLNQQSEIQNQKLKWWLFGFLSLIILVGGFFGYRYFTSTKQIESIAVMPFVNESGNADVEYLSDGMTETLIRSLSQLPNLAVKARSTVFYYKGKETSPQKIGEELHVEAVLLGRIVQRGDDLKLNLELVNTNTQDVIWSESYDRKRSDLVALQSEIARDVSSKLKTKLSGADEAKVTKASTANPEAYQAYLKGRYYWNRRTAENIKKAINQFQTATDLDPQFAQAYAGLADCYALLPEYAGVPTSETAPQARNYAERAIAIESQLAEPHATLGIVAHKSWQWAEAEREFKRAIELNPTYATAYHWYSILLKDVGRSDEAAEMIKRAHELDPLSGAIGCNISMIYQLQNNHEASVKNSLKMIELDPNFGRAYEYLGLSYLKLGRKAEAVTTMEKAVELTKRQNVVLSELGYVYGATGKRAEAIAVAKELEDKYARKEAAGHEVAAVYAGLGEKDKAFEWLEKDFQTRDGRLTTFRWETQFEPLRDDPRFKDLLRRMNLPE